MRRPARAPRGCGARRPSGAPPRAARGRRRGRGPRGRAPSAPWRCADGRRTIDARSTRLLGARRDAEAQLALQDGRATRGQHAGQRLGGAQRRVDGAVDDRALDRAAPRVGHHGERLGRGGAGAVVQLGPAFEQRAARARAEVREHARGPGPALGARPTRDPPRSRRPARGPCPAGPKCGPRTSCSTSLSRTAGVGRHRRGRGRREHVRVSGRRAPRRPRRGDGAPHRSHAPRREAPRNAARRRGADVVARPLERMLDARRSTRAPMRRAAARSCRSSAVSLEGGACDSSVLDVLARGAGAQQREHLQRPARGPRAAAASRSIERRPDRRAAACAGGTSSDRRPSPSDRASACGYAPARAEQHRACPSRRGEQVSPASSSRRREPARAERRRARRRR